MTTPIVVPVSVPGANDSATALTRAADAVEKLARGMEHERQAAATSAAETRKAAQAAKELAAANQAAADSERKAMEAMVARAKATVAAGVQVRSRSVSVERGTSYDVVRMADPGQFTPEWARGGGGGPGGQPGGNATAAASKWGRIGGILPALGASIPGAGGVIGGIAAGGVVAVAAAAAAAIGAGLATAANYIRNAEEAAANIAKSIIGLRKGIEDATDALGKRGAAVSDALGRPLLAAQAQNGKASIAARDSIMSLAGVSMDDALSFERNGLNETQKQAAAKAAIISGKSAGGIADQMAKGHLNGKDADRLAALVLSNSGTPTTTDDVRKQYAAATSGPAATAVIDKIRIDALKGTDSLAMLPAGTNEARADRGRQALAMDPVAAGLSEEYKKYQDQREIRQADADAEWTITRWIKNSFGAQGSASAKLRQLDEQFGAALFSPNAPGAKQVNGAAR